MDLYRPPVLPITCFLPNQAVISDRLMATRFRLPLEAIPTIADQDGVEPAIRALAALIRYYGSTSKRKAAAALDASELRAVLADHVGVGDCRWPWSIAEAVRALTDVCRGHLGVIGPDRIPWITELGTDLTAKVSDPRRVGFVGVAASQWTIKAQLSIGDPVACGLAVSDDWLDAATVATGDVRLPYVTSPPDRGEVIIVDGWDDEREKWSCRFAAGPIWGRDGCGWIPFGYLDSGHLCFERVALTHK